MTWIRQLKLYWTLFFALCAPLVSLVTRLYLYPTSHV